MNRDDSSKQSLACMSRILSSLFILSNIFCRSADQCSPTYILPCR